MLQHGSPTIQSFKAKRDTLGLAGGVSSPGELSILTTLHFLQGALHNKMNKVRVYQHHPKSMGWIPWQHQQWPTILDNQEVNPIWIRAHPIICDYVGRSLSSSGNMINSHGSLGQSSYRMIHDHLHGSLRHSAIFWHGPMLPNTIPSAAMAWIPGASLPLTPLEQLETTKSCWTDTFLSMWPGVT